MKTTRHASVRIGAGEHQAAGDVLDSLAIGLVPVGVFTPFSRISYDPVIRGGDFILMAMSVVVCFALGFALHWYASRQLNGLEP